MINFVRVAKGSHGRRVVALCLVMREAGLRQARPTWQYDWRLERQVKRFQKAEGIPQSGVCGLRTWYATRKYLWRKNQRMAYARWLLLHPVVDPEATRRGRIGNVCAQLYRRRDLIGYSQIRPMRTILRGWLLPGYPSSSVPMAPDCSEFVTLVYRNARLPDPNGQVYSYNGLGNTSTLRDAGRRISYADARVGDLIHYDNPQHVATRVAGGVCSHGSAAAPYMPLPANYRTIVMVTDNLRPGGVND